jgi:hypothetical protein
MNPTSQSRVTKADTLNQAPFGSLSSTEERAKGEESKANRAGKRRPPNAEP